MTVDNPGPTPPDPAQPAATPAGFQVRLRNFEGPFDLLLTLISQHRLDVTEVALHEVTDEFIAYTRALGPRMGLDQTTEFLVVAATLLGPALRGLFDNRPIFAMAISGVSLLFAAMALVRVQEPSPEARA